MTECENCEKLAELERLVAALEMENRGLRSRLDMMDILANSVDGWKNVMK